VHSFAPNYSPEGDALFICTNAAGGSGHVFYYTNPPLPEVNMNVVEIRNGGLVQDVEYNVVYSPSADKSANVTATSSAVIIATWAGDAGGLTYTAVPDNGFSVILSMLSGGVDGEFFQNAMAAADVSAGTYNVTWAETPIEGAHMWMVAVQSRQSGISAPNLNWSSPADIVYGTPLGSSQLNATATFNSTNVSGTFTYAPPGGTILKAGRAQTLSVTFTPTDTSALRAVSQNVTINVDPLAVVLAGSRNYDGTTAAAAATLSVANVVGSDVVTVASGSGTLAGAGLGPQALTGVGTLALGGAAAANYTLNGASGTVTIHAAPLTITATAQAKAYGAALSLGTTAFSVGSGLAAGQTVTGVSLTANGGTAATAPVGSYVITPSGATGAGGFLAGNYNITYSTGTLAVNPLAVVLAGSRNYDGTTVAAAATLSVANVVGSDVVTVASGSGTLAGAGVGPQALTGVGTLALGGAAAAEYTLSGASGTVTIHAAPLTITATAQGKTYGAALSLGTTAFSVGSGLAAGETVTGVSLTANGGTAATAPVGSYVITPSGATGTGGFLASNYNITYSPATLTVNKAILTVTANNAIRVYGQANPAFSANYAGFCNGETLATSGVTGNPSLTTTATATSPVPGPYPITTAIGTLAATNYSFGFVDGELLINKANTVAAINSSTNPALPGASVTFTFTASAVAPGAGTPTGAVNFSIDGFIAGYAALSGGSAVFVTNSLDHGSNTVIGEYAGDANFIGSTNILSPAEVIDTPPVAGPVTIYRGPAGGAQITIANLLTNVSDAEGDAITFVGVSAASANGGTVATNSGWVLYTPAPGFTNADTFTYLVTDSLSAPVAGTVMVEIAIDTGASRNLAITNLDNGSVAIAGQGIPGSTYIVQYTTDTLPTTNWLTLGTVTADSSGAFVLVDTIAPALRFYRAIYP